MIASRTLVASLAGLTVAAGTLSACGGSSGNDKSKSSDSGSGASSGAPASTGGGATTNLTISADEHGGLSFTKKAMTAKAGTVTITMQNPSDDQQPHGISVEGNGVDQDGNVAGPGGTSKVTVTNMKPGKYTFYCPVGDHRMEGMQGTLTVQ